jgi:nitroreductase
MFVLERIKNVIFRRTHVIEFYSKIYDFYHHYKYSFKEYKLKKQKETYKYYLVKSYHVVEKGLALAEPRMQFAEKKIIKLIRLTKEYVTYYGEDALVKSIKSTLLSYMNFHEQSRFELKKDYFNLIKEFVEGEVNIDKGGVKLVKRLDTYAQIFSNTEELIKGRVSVRNFSEQDVPVEEIRKIIDLARNTPSVCNRQGWFIHVYSDKNKIKELLSYQNGNAGFTESINKLLIVTGNAKAFTFSESNQLFIDGGLLSMNILLAIHAAGYGACPLNTCYPAFYEKKVKKIAEISDEQRLIMMIGIGALHKEYTVAYSNKFPVSDILIEHG